MQAGWPRSAGEHVGAPPGRRDATRAQGRDALLAARADAVGESDQRAKLRAELDRLT